MTHQYRSNGKLLITAEYVVLDGALSLALPCKFGQTLTITETNDEVVYWKALDKQNNTWFTVKIDLTRLKKNADSCIISTNDLDKAKTIIGILTEAIKLNPYFLKNKNGVEATTKLEFPQDWGLGSSSTLINNIAAWAKVNAFTLLWNSFPGSGYDIACAQNNTAINYQLLKKQPNIQQISFNPIFKDQLFFVHLNQKQNSREGIDHYRNIANTTQKSAAMKVITNLTKEIQQAKTLSKFEALITEHEKTIGTLINLTPIKERVFSDYKGAIKSLGAWGGDFILVTGSKDEVAAYFNKKGYSTLLSYKEMILA